MKHTANQEIAAAKISHEKIAAEKFTRLKIKGLSNRVAGKIVGIPWQTLYRWQRKHNLNVAPLVCIVGPRNNAFTLSPSTQHSPAN